MDASAEKVNDRRRWLALYVLCVGMLMIVLDITIVNVALPSIQSDLGFSQNDLAWVVNAYLIPFGGLLLLAGRIGDLIGQRRVFLTGLAIFTIASLVCAVAPSQGALIGARFVQGVGGALTGGLMLGVYTILQVTEQGWLASSTIVLGAASVALLAAFLARQARIENPLMPLRLFRSRNVAGANLVQALVVVGMFGMFFLGALYLQRVLGYDPLQVGLAFLPSTLVMGVLSMGLSGRITMRFGAKATLIPSLGL